MLVASPAISAAFDAGPDEVLDQLRASDDPAADDFVERFDQFLVDFGSRAQNEYDLRSASWEVRPRIALAAVDLMRKSDESQSPFARNASAVAERDRILADIRQKIAGDAATAGLFEAALQSAQLFLAGRERAKTNVVRVINEMRVALREFGRRMVERGVIDEIEQIFMLTNAELDQIRFESDSFKPIIAQRWAQYQTLFDYEPVFVVNRRVPSLDEMTRRTGKQVDTAEAGSVLRGAAGSGGVATGRARVDPRCRPPRGTRARRHPHRSTDGPFMGSAVRARRWGRGRSGSDGQPRHDRVARARHPVRRLCRRRHSHHSRWRHHHRRRQRRHGHRPLISHPTRPFLTPAGSHRWSGAIPVLSLPKSHP